MANGLDQLRRRLESVARNVRTQIDPALKVSADEIARTMRSLAETSSDTGSLIESIAVTEGGNSTPPYSQPGGATVVPEHAVVITAGNVEARHVHLVEYGTVSAPAQPFFWPGFRLMRKRAENRIKRNISKAVRDGWNQ
ncbi:MAG: HK97-gp10 family putative phage morphogenesis protein [Allorhizobium sp.]